MRDSWPHRGRLRPWVLGHRGARREAPENTLVAFERAMQLGADGVELDVRLSRDGVVVVCHDPELSRATNGRDCRAVSSLSASELAKVDLGSGATVPTLIEVLNWATATGALLNIELKSDQVPLLALARAVTQTCAQHYPKDGPALVFSSFHLGLLLLLGVLGAQGKRAWLVHREQRFAKKAPGAVLLGLAGVHPQHDLLARCPVECWHLQSLFIGTWTVNTEDEIRRAAGLGADVLISDNPQLARKIV